MKIGKKHVLVISKGCFFFFFCLLMYVIPESNDHLIVVCLRTSNMAV